MSEKDQLSILTSFGHSEGLYRDYAKAMQSLIVKLLQTKLITVHSVTERCKSRESLERKIARPEKNYAALSDITDIAAVRIITYFSDDVDNVAALIKSEFYIDKVESIDKRKFDSPDRFGYQSMHLIASLHSSRANLTEHREFSALRFEIQIRSILQHAWAEIEHDLGYKSSIGVPHPVRRRFARVAGLLELADDEFLGIRGSLNKYEKQLPERIGRDPFAVGLDLTSLRALYDSESRTKGLDALVANASKGKILDGPALIADDDIKRLNIFGIFSVGQLEASAKAEHDVIPEFVKYWGAKPGSDFPVSIGIFYLAYVLAWRSQDHEKITKSLATLRIGEERIQALAKRILEFQYPR